MLAALFFLWSCTEVESSAKIPRIGFLLAGGSPETARRDGFLQGLRELGYVEGKSIVIEWRAAGGTFDRLDELARELVRLKVDVFVTSGNAVTRAAKKATRTIPIVAALVSYPVENGFIESLARPGSNITGLTNLGAELTGKRLELLKEVLPRLSRLLVLGNSSTPGSAQTVQETEVAAKGLGVQLAFKDSQNLVDFEAGINALVNNRFDAGLMLPNAALLLHRDRVVQLAAEHRLPMMYDAREYVQSGGLISYAADAVDLFRRSAVYVDKILKGANPGSLPVEQPKRFELIINLKTTKQIGLTIPPNVLARADRVIR